MTRTGAGLAPLTVDADAASFDYPAAQRAADAAAGAATVVFEVRQIGAGGASAPASIDLSIL